MVFGFAPTIVTFLVTRRTNTTVIALIANVLAIRMNIWPTIIMGSRQ